MSKVKREFSVETILRALLKEYVDSWTEDRPPTEQDVDEWIDCCIYEAEFISSDEFENVHQLVFEKDGKHWSCWFERNDGAGYNDFIPYRSWESESYVFLLQEDGSWALNEEVVGEDARSFTCVEVHKVTKTIEVWEPVKEVTDASP